MAAPHTIPCLIIGRHRGIARSIAGVLAPHGFSVNGILVVDSWSNSEFALVLRGLEPCPQAILLGGGYSDEETEKTRSVFEEYKKETDIANGKLVRVEPGAVGTVGPQHVATWILEQLCLCAKGLVGELTKMEDLNLPTSLQETLIRSLPASGYYIPNFITPAEEQHLLQKIDTAPLPAWKYLSHRCLQAHPSTLSSSNTLLAADLPAWLSNPVIPRLLSISVSPDSKDNILSHSPHSAPNHCLINEYQPGQGIHAHEDGDAYYPVVATVSLGSHIVLNVKPKNEAKDAGWRILQESRSLLITTGELYTQCLHGIGDVKVDEDLGGGNIVNWGLLGNTEAFRGGSASRETRISLTFRDVKKVQRLGKAFGALERK